MNFIRFLKTILSCHLQSKVFLRTLNLAMVYLFLRTHSQFQFYVYIVIVVNLGTIK